jgi:hypothetical protein
MTYLETVATSLKPLDVEMGVLSELTSVQILVGESSSFLHAVDVPGGQETMPRGIRLSDRPAERNPSLSSIVCRSVYSPKSVNARCSQHCESSEAELHWLGERVAEREVLVKAVCDERLAPCE